MQNFIVYMQFIIQMSDPFTLLGLFLVSTSVMCFLLHCVLLYVCPLEHVNL